MSSLGTFTEKDADDFLIVLDNDDDIDKGEPCQFVEVTEGEPSKDVLNDDVEKVMDNSDEMTKEDHSNPEEEMMDELCQNEEANASSFIFYNDDNLMSV